jgi:polyferredoxin
MEKMHYPTGLISFTTENVLEKGTQFRLLRPRLLAYFAVLILMCSVFVYEISSRIALEVDVVRDRSMLYRVTQEGLVENSYKLKINNMDQRDHQYSISVISEQALIYRGQSEVGVAEGEVVEMLVRLLLPLEQIKQTNIEIEFVVTATSEAALQNSEKSRFIAPLKTTH